MDKNEILVQKLSKVDVVKSVEFAVDKPLLFTNKE